MKAMILIAAAALPACELMYEPDVGPLQADSVDGGMATGDGGTIATGACGDSDPSAVVSFARDVRPLLAKSPGGCQGCHGTAQTSGFSVGTYESLRRGGQNSGLRIIVSGDPCNSILAQKLGAAPPFGARMPYNGPPYFTSAELRVLRDWIAEGAHDN